MSDVYRIASEIFIQMTAYRGDEVGISVITRRKELEERASRCLLAAKIFAEIVGDPPHEEVEPTKESQNKPATPQLTFAVETDSNLLVSVGGVKNE